MIDNQALKIEDVVYQAIRSGATLIADIQKQILIVRNNRITWKNVFYMRKILDEHQTEYNKLFDRFFKTYIFDHQELETFNNDDVIRSNMGKFSYLFATLASSMRNNLSDTQQKNSLILASLNAQSDSYLNMLHILQNAFVELNREISNRYQELNTQQMLILNAIMLGLTAITVILSLQNFSQKTPFESSVFIPMQSNFSYSHSWN